MSILFRLTRSFYCNGTTVHLTNISLCPLSMKHIIVCIVVEFLKHYQKILNNFIAQKAMVDESIAKERSCLKRITSGDASLYDGCCAGTGDNET